MCSGSPDVGGGSDWLFLLGVHEVFVFGVCDGSMLKLELSD